VTGEAVSGEAVSGEAVSGEAVSGESVSGESVSGGAGAGGAGAAGALRTASGPLAAGYDVALLDLDGVIYLGGSAIPGAVDALEAASAAGMRLAFVTNNASRTPSAVAAQLSGFGLTARASDVVTSSHAAARLLAERLPPGSAVLVVGSMSLRLAVAERGLRPVSLASDRPAAVVQGYTPGLNYSMLAEAGLAVAAGALFVGTNADSTLPTPRGRQPGNGSLLQVVATATGQQPLVAGKPEAPLHAEAVARSGAHHPLVVGDRLDTDIEGAGRAGTDSLLVLTGVSRPLDLVLAPPRQRPTYLAQGLDGLLAGHPAVTAVDGGFRCGGWQARWADPGKLTVTGSGEPLDGLRAVCVAAWSADAGDGRTADAVEPALSALGR
jgi:HAD superfamily hydrolase (TIGR01450 family)